MANIKVSEMTEATTFDDGDYTMIVQANQNKKIARENILGDIEDDISTINTNIGDLSNLETSDTSSIVNSINEINSTRLKKLWENENPTNNFSPQTLSFNASQYDYFIIVYKNTASSTINNSKFIIKNTRFSLDGINAGRLYARNSDNNGISDTGVTFGAGIYIGTYGSETQTNELSIPIIIYGGKF